MEERNEFLEIDGLYWESETHEWFYDKLSTSYAQKNTLSPSGEEYKDGLNVICFVIRNKETGEYDRVMMDKKKNEIVYDTKSIEALASEIDKIKLLKRFK